MARQICRPNGGMWLANTDISRLELGLHARMSSRLEQESEQGNDRREMPAKCATSLHWKHQVLGPWQDENKFHHDVLDGL